MPSVKQHKSPIQYIRTKNSTKIIGDPNETKGIIYLDLLLTKGWPIILTIILLFILPKASFLPFLWQYIKSRWLPFTIFLAVQAEYSLFLSG